LTLHNCEIYYLSAVNYNPAATDIIFSRIYNYIIFINYPGPVVGGLKPILYPLVLSGSLFTQQPYPSILSEVTIYPARLTRIPSGESIWGSRSKKKTDY
jgi:hypothetical protein